MSNSVKVFRHFEAPKEEGTYFRLVCLTGKNKGEAYFLMGKRVVIGRSETADIRVYDIKSSREHAEIVKVGKDYILTDLGSQNGVVINDLKIRQHILNENDKVIIGQTVYKFNSVKVETKKQKSLLDQFDNEDEEDNEEEQPKSRLVPILIILILGAVFLLLDGDEKPSVEDRRDSARFKLNEMDPFSGVIEQRKKEDRKTKEKLNLYFQKGLREFRENNYYRAISEFNNALSWAPGDPLAEFYVRKTKESLDKAVKSEFNAAIRDIEALKYQNAIVHYCSIIRLLRNFTSSEDRAQVKDAENGISEMEKKLGLDEGEVECAETTNGGDS